ncbi:immunoglobulin [Escherichia albertii]|uniref:Immunoglobulin n=1 Tax=Escherichia albertii TaxID=208962 RepID=A0A2T3RVE2_ESCAL|nr:immunoglobulin [Escherichia albertii]EEW6708375.1 immunoglobulin [Escherichia albertii]EEW7495245.1 immunoglobulin [Escherichia albertii]EEW7549372.1 immunoglobulin [Escherichia albertii]EFO0110336.1 immunoglobulin [Escherichia albertii]
MCILLLFNKANTVYSHAITNNFPLKSLFTSQHGCKAFCILNISNYLFKL